MKKMNFAKIGFVLLLFLIITSRVNAQNECTTAVTLPYGYLTEHQFQDDRYHWIKFTADTLNYFFNIVQPIDTPAANVIEISLYGDSCSNLSLITSATTQNFDYDSLRIFANNLTLGETYYVCVKQDTTLKSFFKIWVERFYNKSWSPYDCPPPQLCYSSGGLISNGTFKPDSIADSVVDWFLTQNNPAGMVCGWQTAWGTPQVITGANAGYPTLAAGDYAAYMWAKIFLYSEGIYQNLNYGTPQPGERYSLSFKYATNTTLDLNVVLTNDAFPYVPNQYGTHNFSSMPGSDLYLVQNEAIYNTNSQWIQKTVCISNLTDTYDKICFYPRNTIDNNSRGMAIDDVSLVRHSFEIASPSDTFFCSPQCIDITTAPCPPADNDLGITWSFSWSNGETTQNINVCPEVTTTYTVTATNSCNYTFTDEVTITIGVTKPEIKGNNNTCDTNTIYTITNVQPGNSYYWGIGDNSYSSSFPQWGTSIPVVWQPLWGSTEYTWMYVTTVDSLTGCKAKDSIRIWQCCKSSAQTTVVSDDTIKDASAFSISPPVYFNGTIVIDSNISVSNDRYIYMGPEAKFVVNPPYTFTLTNSKIQAGCRYMWDGIYVTDSNAKVVIQDSSWIEDALNSVYSEYGGKFELKNSSFYNNYTSVLVKNNFYGVGVPTYSHKGIIYGCLFDEWGTGNIAPYSGDKQRHGVRLENVYNLTVGDSTQDSNKFKNIFCGIASFNSSVNVYNNHFYFINSLGSSSSVAGDFYNLNGETAIHGAAIFQDSYHLTSRLTCGAGANSSNTFDTCNTAIYTYHNLNRINYAKVIRCGLGVRCREPRTNSYVTNSTFRTNIRAGIEFINVLPLYNGITVKYDSILNPMCGINMTNIRSHALSLAFKTKVSNNYITNVREWPMWGINITKCDYIEAYCNMVRRSIQPSPGYQWFIRGIAIDQSLSAQIHDNTSDSIGVGIKGRGALQGTQFKCNVSDGNYNGFYFNDILTGINSQTALSAQGTLSSPNDNTWYHDVTNFYRIDGTYTGIPIYWYYRGDPYLYNQYYPSVPTSLINNITPEPAINPVAVNCQSCTYGTMMAGNSNQPANQISSSSSTGINNTELTAIMNESNNYQQLDESFKYFEKQYAYQKLEENQQLLTTTQSNYFYSLKNSNIGKFEQIYQELKDDNISSAVSINNQISPTNNIETYRKWVNSVYFDYIIPQKPLPQNIINDLVTLASSSPFVNGDAVYSARAIVDYTDPEAIEKPKSLKQNNPNSNSGSKHDITVNVYPNPAENIINVEIKGLNGEPCKFVIRNILGTGLIEREIKAEVTKITIDISKLSNGLYFYEVLNTVNENIKNARFVISK